MTTFTPRSSFVYGYQGLTQEVQDLEDDILWDAHDATVMFNAGDDPSTYLTDLVWTVEQLREALTPPKDE